MNIVISQLIQALKFKQVKKVIPFDNRVKQEGVVYNTISTNFKEYQAKLAQKGAV